MSESVTESAAPEIAGAPEPEADAPVPNNATSSILPTPARPPHEWVATHEPPANAVDAGNLEFIVRDRRNPGNVGKYTGGVAKVMTWFGRYTERVLEPAHLEFLCMDGEVGWLRQELPPARAISAAEGYLLVRAATGATKGALGRFERKAGRAYVLSNAGREVALQPAQLEFCIAMNESTAIIMTGPASAGTPSATDAPGSVAASKSAATKMHPEPSDAGQGLLHGVGYAVAGVGYGVAAVVAAPVVGYKEHGVRGAAMGTLLGGVAGVGATVVGAARGLFAVGDGIAQTPRKLHATVTGKEWDPLGGRYDEYSLPRELERMRAVDVDKAFAPEPTADAQAPADEAAEASAARSPASACKETQLYDLLGVVPTATDVELKRAYFRRSRELHPDKNRDDPSATERFQAVGHAYQVSRVTSRARLPPPRRVPLLEPSAAPQRPWLELPLRASSGHTTPARAPL